MSESSYDAIPYPKYAFPQTHPNILATIGTLFGLRPAPPQKCRVLELGSASGTNLLPMAFYQPESQFVGIELSEVQVQEAREQAAKLDLKNLEFRHGDLLQIDASIGEFDYIIAHGVFSWVPRDVQEKILAICGERLSPQGIAYISFNVYPGWHSLRAIRELMLFHGSHFPDPRQRLREGRSILRMAQKGLAGRDDNYARYFGERLKHVLEQPENYVFHEFLEADNDPIYFHEFAGRAAQHGLQYVGEVPISSMAAFRLPPGWEAVPRETTEHLVALEQYIDFLQNRQFRQTLLCRGDVAARRKPDPAAVRELQIVSKLERKTLPNGQAQFQRGIRQLTTADPLMIAACETLTANWPRPLSFADLFAAAKQPGGDAPAEQDRFAAVLLEAAVHELVDLSVVPAPSLAQPTDRPRLNALARMQLEQGQPVMDRFGQALNLPDLTKLMVRLMDGRKCRVIVDDMLRRIHAGELKVDRQGQAVTDESVLRPLLEGEINSLVTGLIRHDLLA